MLFERIENSFQRLKTNIEAPQTAAMTDMTVKLMTEVLSILAIATKETNQGVASELVLVDRPQCQLTLDQERIRGSWWEVLILRMRCRSWTNWRKRFGMRLYKAGIQHAASTVE